MPSSKFSSQRIPRTFVRRGLIGTCDDAEMAAGEHGGSFSADAAMRIGGDGRAGLERLLRYFARPPLALEHMQERDAEHLARQSHLARRAWHICLFQQEGEEFLVAGGMPKPNRTPTKLSTVRYNPSVHGKKATRWRPRQHAARNF